MDWSAFFSNVEQTLTFLDVVGRNICHGSDSVENAEREIGLWFEDGEVMDWTSHSFDWLYE